MMAFIFIAMFFLGKLINGSVIIFTIYDGDRARDLDLDQDQDQEREREIRELIGVIRIIPNVLLCICRASIINAQIKRSK